MSRRRLGLRSLSAIVIANMVGAGVFTSSGFALGSLGAAHWVLLAWLVGGVLALLGALSYGALAVYLRESGGEYLFLSRTIHPRAGFVAGWVSLFAGFTGAIAVAASAAEAYLEPWFGGVLPKGALSAALIVLAGTLHAVRLSPGVRVQNMAVAIKLALLVAMAVAGAVVIAVEGRAPQVHAVTTPPSLGAFATTLMWISLSYSGWNAAVYVAGEAKDPERNLPRALLLGCAAIMLLYLVWNAVVLYSGPEIVLANKPDVAAVAAQLLAGELGGHLVRIAIVLALWTSVSSMIMIGPRVYARMADDGCLPRFLRFEGETPRAAILMQVVLAILLLGFDLQQQLSNLGWILSLSTALAVAGLLRERRRVGAANLPIPGGAVVAWVFLVSTVGLGVIAFVENPGELSYAAAVLGSGVLFATLFQGRAQKRQI